MYLISISVFISRWRYQELDVSYSNRMMAHVLCTHKNVKNLQSSWFDLQRYTKLNTELPVSALRIVNLPSLSGLMVKILTFNLLCISIAMPFALELKQLETEDYPISFQFTIFKFCQMSLLEHDNINILSLSLLF